jgi:hypothetical protein
LNVSIGEANEKGYCPYRDRWKRIWYYVWIFNCK